MFFKVCRPLPVQCMIIILINTFDQWSKQCQMYRSLQDVPYPLNVWKLSIKQLIKTTYRKFWRVFFPRCEWFHVTRCVCSNLDILAAVIRSVLPCCVSCRQAAYCPQLHRNSLTRRAYRCLQDSTHLTRKSALPSCFYSHATSIKRWCPCWCCLACFYASEDMHTFY